MIGNSESFAESTGADGSRLEEDSVDLQLENEVLRSELETAKSSLKQLQTRFLSELSSAKRSKNGLEQRVAELEQQLQTVARKERTGHTESDRLEQHQAQQPHKQEEKQQQHEQNQKQSHQQSSWEQCSSQLSALRDEKEATESLLVVTRAELEKLKAAHRELRNDYDCLVQQNSALSTAHDADRLRIEELDTELRSRDSAAAASDAKQQAQHEEAERARRMEKKVLSLHSKCETLKAALLRRESECLQTSREKALALQQLEELRSSTLMLRLQGEETTAATHRLQQEVHQLRSELDEKHREYDALIESNERNVEDLAEERDRNELLHRELEQKQKELRKALAYLKKAQQAVLFGDSIQMMSSSSQLEQHLPLSGKKKPSGWHHRQAHGRGSDSSSVDAASVGPNVSPLTATNNATSLMSSLALVSQQKKGGAASTAASTPTKGSYFESGQYFSMPSLPRMNTESIMNAAKGYVSSTSNAAASAFAAAESAAGGVMGASVAAGKGDDESDSHELHHNPFFEEGSDILSDDGYDEVEFLDSRIFYGGNQPLQASGTRSPSSFQRLPDSSSPVPTERDSTTVEGEQNSRSNSTAAATPAASAAQQRSHLAAAEFGYDFAAATRGTGGTVCSAADSHPTAASSSAAAANDDDDEEDDDDVSDDESNDALVCDLRDQISSLTIAKLEHETRIRELEAELSMTKDSLEACHQRANRLNAKVMQLSKIEFELEKASAAYAATKEELQHTKQLLGQINDDHQNQAELVQRVRMVVQKQRQQRGGHAFSHNQLEELAEILAERA